MTRMRFEWDEAKDASNRRKHDGISFAVAARVFFDPLSITTQDQVVDGELRWRTVGTVEGAKLLIVAHTTTEETAQGDWIEVIRIVSARRATRTERRRYEDQDD